jgi:hypothetical protein
MVSNTTSAPTACAKATRSSGRAERNERDQISTALHLCRGVRKRDSARQHAGGQHLIFRFKDRQRVLDRRTRGARGDDRLRNGVDAEQVVVQQPGADERP